MRFKLSVLLVVALLTTACTSSNAATTPTSEPTTGNPGTTSTSAPGTTSTTPAPPTFTGADGVESTIDDTSRIVTLSGDLTETVYKLGFGDSVVATDVTTVYPPEAVGLPVVGVGRFLSAEGVLAQQPTLVIGDTQTSPVDAIEQIRSAGVPVVILDVPTTFEGLYEKIGGLAEALGVPSSGADIVAELRSDIETALSAAPERDPKPGVAFVYSRGPDVMLLFGSEMTTQPLIEAAGGTDVGTESGVTGTISVTPEAIVAAAPDVIIITSEGLQALGGEDGLLAIPGFAETPAGRDGRILDYPEGDFLTFGPRTAESLALLIADLSAVLTDQ
ncbi:MAG: ABC transporter substrate-binding protein [Acidimicrobiia bacterium]|nr:ABC transporter substrate-binding protein [Acidimicrobiia bacterium]NNJ48475.1 ABC transporter substrate-binding protein [Acidimicrobiia bacterium]NNL98456.1 ABC transporter substrate-binding protein [Acidimicrobiia bacterium]